MNPKVGKLAQMLGDEDLAVLLVEVGFDNPRKIRDVSNRELDAAIGRAARVKVREKVR